MRLFVLLLLVFWTLCQADREWISSGGDVDRKNICFVILGILQDCLNSHFVPLRYYPLS